MGSLLGFAVGLIFTLNLSSLIRCISRHHRARKEKKSYIEYLKEHNESAAYVSVVEKTGVSKLMSTKFVEVLSYLFKILVLIFSVVILLLFVILYTKGYSELFNMRW